MDWNVVALAPLGYDESFDWASTIDQVREMTGVQKFTVLACGESGVPLPKEILQSGAREVIWVERSGPDDPSLSLSALGEVLHATLEKSALDHKRLLIVAPAGAFGAALIGDLACRLDAIALGRCMSVQLDAAIHVRRSVFGGRAEVEMTVEQGPVLLLLQGNAAKFDGSLEASPVQKIEISEPNCPLDSTMRFSAEGKQKNLQGAAIVVSGGRGMNEEGFALLEQIAGKLDAAVGASLPAVDAGLAPVSQQIGQSGHFVTPQVYLAVGLSGTPQHLAGVGDMSRIFAINKDRSASIFSFAEIGIIGDWHEVLPLLIARLEAG